MIVSAVWYAWKRVRPRWAINLAIVLGGVFAVAGNSLFHESLFTVWHQSQNNGVPDAGCISYEPSCLRLYATYSMRRDEFEKWVATHPFEMKPYDLSLAHHDYERLGFTDPEVAYATDMASNGKQLRTYYKDGVMYLSYNVM
ncbi:MAG: hypothetical protein KDB27_11900 [Planctomycetales bacterium]|nr:hypothetical protein [Planctomycetales bacterium]